MHIIVLENEVTSFRGGQELNLIEICRGLSQRGHTISLIFLKEGNLLEQYQEFCDYLGKVNRYGFDRRKVSDILNFILGLVSLLKIPVRGNSVIFCNDHSSIFFGYLLSLFKRIPLVCYFQFVPDQIFTHQKILGLKHAKQFVAVSNQTKLNWAKSGIIKEEKINVVYNGTNTEKFQPTENLSFLRKEWNIPKNTKVVSYVGRLDKEKGLETLLRAFALFVQNGTNAKLLIAGKPLLHFTSDGKEHPEEGEKYKHFLIQLSNDLGIEKYVEFLGHITKTTSIYQVSDVTVLPSLWSEPFGRVIIESMACGTPVVASRVGGIPEILTGEFQSWLFEPGNERDLANTLNRMINWRDTNSHLSERCREHVLSKFTLDRMVDGIEKVLLKILDFGQKY